MGRGVAIPSVEDYPDLTFYVTSYTDNVYNTLNSETSLGYHVFDGCSSLASITFENTTGWYVTDSSDYTGGTSIDVTDPTTNATNLKSYRGSWCAQYLYRVDV